MLDAGVLGLECARERKRAIEVAVEVEAPGTGGCVISCRRVVPHIAGHGGHATYRVIRAIGVVLEVGDQHSARRIDAEEPVHVDVGRRLGLLSTLGHERDGGGDATAAGRRAHARAVTPEPGLDREVGHVEACAVAERHVVVRAIEVDAGTNRCGRRRGRLVRRTRIVVGSVDGSDGIEVRRSAHRRVVDIGRRCHECAAVERCTGSRDRARRGPEHVVPGQIRLSVGVPGQCDAVRPWSCRQAGGCGRGECVRLRREGPGRSGGRARAIACDGVPLVIRTAGQAGPGDRSRSAGRGAVHRSDRLEGAAALQVEIEDELAVGVRLVLPCAAVPSGRVGVDVELVLGWLEGHDAQPSVATVGTILVVGQELVHRLPASVQIGAPTLPRIVAVEDHYHVAIGPDEALPDGLGRVAIGQELRRRAAVVGRIDEEVGRDDCQAVWILLQDPVRPVEGVVGHVELEVQDDEIQAAVREQLVVVLVQAVDRIRHELAQIPAIPAVAEIATRREILVEEAAVAVGRVDVVVTGCEVVGHAVVVERVHGGISALPLDFELVGVLHHVALVGHE